MSNAHLPDIMLGNWIWVSSESTGEPEHALFRRDFILDTLPGSSELLLAAHCACKVFVNGRFFTFGPPPHPIGNTYLCSYDITHLLQLGVNSIAIHAFYHNVATTSHARRSRGLWLQLVNDGAPILWSDETWLTMQLDCYAITDLTASPAEGAVEILDHSLFPRDWLNLTQRPLQASGAQEQDSLVWQPPAAVWTAREDGTTFEPAPADIPAYEQRQPLDILARSRLSRRNEVLNVSFVDIFNRNRQPGFYAAETFVTSPDDAPQIIFCFSATPYKLLINGVIVAERNVPPKHHRYSFTNTIPEDFARLDNSEDAIETSLASGVNHIVVVKWCDTPCSNFTLIFANRHLNELHHRRQAADGSQAGWSVAGPVRTPFPLIGPNFSLSQLPRIATSDSVNTYRDTAAISLGGEFLPDPENASQTTLPIQLAEGQSVVVDFGKTLYAIPEVTLAGQHGDVLDLVAGEHLAGCEVLALENGTRRNTSTIILDGNRRPFPWLLNENKGFRYLMLVARTARTVITVHQVSAHVSQMDPKTPGRFECSDELLNRIWHTGVSTLNTTFQGRFLDSPTKDQTQCIPEAMRQAAAACATHGAFRQEAEAISAFARTQLETGDLNVLTPSAFYQTIPDFSLLWPVWLQKHLLQTGDQLLARQLIPNLTHLLDFYNSIATENNGPLGNVAEILGNPPYLDLGDIDTAGISTGLNAIYCRALFASAWIADFCEFPELQKQFHRRAARVAVQIRKLAWNPDFNLYADSFANGQPSPFASWQTNVLAIYGGIATPEQTPLIWSQLFLDDPPYEALAAGDANNPYFKAFILDIAADDPEHRVWALNLIRHYWGSMLDAGATTWWELHDPENPAGTSRICSHCHGAAAMPNAFLLNHVAGLIPAAPGMNTFFFNPIMVGIDWCRATVPTPLGPVSVSWERKVNHTIAIAISASHPIEIIPILSTDDAQNAIFSVSDNVTILAQNDNPEPEA